MIKIWKSPTADTRTCDYQRVDKETLLNSSRQHIADVRDGLTFFIFELLLAARRHDYTKLRDIDGFYRDFSSGFKTQDWYTMHKAVERHHLDKPEGVRHDVNLIDVLEHVVDCVMAGMARSGTVRDIELSNELLQKALHNTVEMLKDEVKVES